MEGLFFLAVQIALLCIVFIIKKHGKISFFSLFYSDN